VECGFKYNMMDLQAVMGIHQLRRIEENYAAREKIWDRYQEAFSDLPVTTPAALEPDTRHALHLYTLLIDESRAGISRDDFLNRMTTEKIGTGVHYLSVADHPYYQENYGWSPDDVPCATAVGRQTVSLPISAKLDDDDVARIIAAVRKIVA
jgi:dTDP-4-amino-4,6-dideoxygalactose transaminase